MMLEVLVSCMNQLPETIIDRLKLQEYNTLIINQCKVDTEELLELSPRHRMLITNTRGLSVSRNLGIQHSKADICVLSDDDETFITGFDKKIVDAYSQLNNADIIAFDIINHPCSLKKRQRINRLSLYKIASCQITFRREKINEKGIRFDPLIGSGTGNGAGEENKFLQECVNSGLKIYYCPISIAVLNDSPSQWFKGYNSEYFYNDGKTNRYVMGFWIGGVYCLYYLIFKYKLYKGQIGFLSATKSMFSGFFRNELAK